jgi:hypothetical protein
MKSAPATLPSKTGDQTELRSVVALKRPNVVPATVGSERPIFEWVDPKALLIDGSYQRRMSPRSVALIDKIISSWDWRHFKPPIVAPTEHGLEVIDGQHTAIAAASHPDIDKIPVMRVVAPERAHRAGAFIGHNKDRIAITSLQLFHAALTAGEPAALEVAEACAAAGVRILKYPPPKGEYGVGDTLAVTAIRKLAASRRVEGAYRVLKVLRSAELTPISAGAIKAVEMLLFDPEFSGQIREETITAAFYNHADRFMHEAGVFASTHRVPHWRALGLVIFRARHKTN